MVEDRIKTIYTSESLYNALSEEEKMNPDIVYWIEPDWLFNKYNKFMLEWIASKEKKDG